MADVSMGKNRLLWAKTHMGIMARLSDRLKKEKPLKGLKIAMALHVEAKTGILALSLREAGADVRLASCNPLSTDNSVSEALNKEYGLPTYAKKGETIKEYYENLDNVLDIGPDILVDDGADLITITHTRRKELLEKIIGANEETTTGVVRVRAMERGGKLRYPVISVNDAYMKHLFDNRYGTGQSTFDGIMNATNLLVAGKTVVVAGYGWCGRGIATRAKGMGASIIVTEVDPVRAIEARMDGFEVMKMEKAAKLADFIISATGDKDVVAGKHLKDIKDGCVLANSGHFNNEISREGIESFSTSSRKAREFVEEFKLKNGRKIYLLADGRLVNLSAGQGHPVEIMDMSFSLQLLSAIHLAKHHKKMENKVYPVPNEIDMNVAKLKLEVMGIQIDKLTKEQERYMQSWGEGT
ncbi:MAG: adenosylhomocysteinase [Thermoplasmata archaeon]